MNIPISKAVSAYTQMAKQAGGISNGDSVTANKDIGNNIVNDAGKIADIENNSEATPSFPDLVAAGLEKARAAGYNTEAVSTEAIANKAELHELVTAVSNAELTLNTVVALRDRIITAYQDLIKMPI